MEFLTADEKILLQTQLKERITKRKELSDRIGTAREMGDLKENAEYHAAREDQGLNEAKIRQLEARLAQSTVVDADDIPEDVVYTGRTVKLREVNSGDEDLYRLVGETTGDLNADYVEVTQNSPMGLALMRARVGETVRVSLPHGEKHFEIVELVE